MDYKDVNHLIDEGEGFEIEFKRKVSTPEKIARALIAFANTQGGHILFGVDDDGSIVGVESEKSEVDLILEAGSLYCLPEITPSIDIVAFDGKDVIVAYVEESDGQAALLHRQQQRPDGKRGRDEGLHPRERQDDDGEQGGGEDSARSSGPDAPPMQIEIGENEKRLFRYLDEHERITAKEFSNLVNISEQRASRILVSLVRAGVVRIHTLEKRDFFTLAYDIAS